MRSSVTAKMTPLNSATAGGPAIEATEAFVFSVPFRCELSKQGSVSLKAAPKKGAAAVRANPLIARYETILKRQELVWVSRRPFLRCLGTGGQGIVFLSQRLRPRAFSPPRRPQVFFPP